MPGGLVAGDAWASRVAAWLQSPTKLDEVIVHAFHEDYWGNWMWTVKNVDPASGEVHFSRGGFQEARYVVRQGLSCLSQFDNISYCICAFYANFGCLLR